MDGEVVAKYPAGTTTIEYTRKAPFATLGTHLVDVVTADPKAGGVLATQPFVVQNGDDENDKEER